jgi:Apea-like HEPN
MLDEKIAILAKAVREAVRKYKLEDCIQTRKQVRIRRTDFTLRYVENFSLGNFPSQRIEEDIWDSGDYGAFETSVLMNLEEYKSLVSALQATNPEYTLSANSFIRVMAFRSWRGLSDQKLTEDAQAFAREITPSPIRVELTALIDGISISDALIVISDSLSFRRPLQEDMAEYISLDELGGFSFPKGQAFFRVVGEFTYDVLGTGIAQDNFLSVIQALRLFRVGGVVSGRYSMTGRTSFLNQGVATLGGSGRPSRYVYTLSPSDSASVEKFLEDVIPLLPSPSRVAQSMTEREIALARYDEALFQDGPPEKVITSSVTGLEALFLTNEPELRHRLAQRVSVFLRVLGSQPDGQITYDSVSKGYGIRSTFIHGGSVKLKDQPEAVRLAPILLELARSSVLAFFQLTIPKAELLKQLDRTMVDPTSESKLRSEFASVRHK